MSFTRGPFKFIGVLTVFTASVPVAGSPGVRNHEVPLVSGRSRFTSGSTLMCIPREPIKFICELTGYMAGHLSLCVREFAIIKFHR